MTQDMIIIGSCRCGGYGQIFNEETEAEIGVCHRGIGEDIFGHFVTAKLKGVDDCRQGVVINVDPLVIRGINGDYECEGTPRKVEETKIKQELNSEELSEELSLEISFKKNRIKTLEAENARLKRREAELVEMMKAIRDYEPKETEVCIDEFAYDRLVEAYRDVARAALAKGGE